MAVEHVATTQDILLNVGIQVVNLGLFFFIFIKFFGKRLSEQVMQRKELLQKAEQADVLYEAKMQQAKMDVQQLLAEANKHKQQVIDQATQLAQIKQNAILEKAAVKSQEMQQQVEQRAKLLEQEMESQFVSSVKHTATLVVQKLFKKVPQFEQQYVDELVQEVVK
ncbi:MAG: hypothetical protein Q8O99_06935 [bacterium]|nr:hypothetical protein [bacterium]